MIKSDNNLFLPPTDELTSMEDVRAWMQKASNLLNNKQSDTYDDLQTSVQKTGKQTVNGAKLFNTLQIASRTDDPSAFELSQMYNGGLGYIYIRSDLL